MINIQTSPNQYLIDLSLYGRKYKQYLIDNCSLSIIHQMKNRLAFFSPAIIDAAELLCEIDICYQIQFTEQHYKFNQRAKHLYNNRYSFLSSFNLSKNNLSAFIYWLKELTKGSIINKCDIRASRSLAFKLALDVYVNHFQYKGMLH